MFLDDSKLQKRSRKARKARQPAIAAPGGSDESKESDSQTKEISNKSAVEATGKVTASATFDILKVIPNEIWVSIFSYLGFKDLVVVGSLCKQFKEVIDSNHLYMGKECIIDETRLLDSGFFKGFSKVDRPAVIPKLSALSKTYQFFNKYIESSAEPVTQPPQLRVDNNLKLRDFFGKIFNFNQPETSLIALRNQPQLVVALLNFAIKKIEQEIDINEANNYRFYNAQLAMFRIAYAVEHLLSLTDISNYTKKRLTECHDKIITLVSTFAKLNQQMAGMPLMKFTPVKELCENVSDNTKEPGEKTENEKNSLLALLEGGSVEGLKYGLKFLKEKQELKDYSVAEIFLKFFDKDLCKIIRIHLIEYNGKIGDLEEGHIFKLAHQQLCKHRQLLILRYLFIEEESLQEVWRKPFQFREGTIVKKSTPKNRIESCFFDAILEKSLEVIDILLESEVKYYQDINKLQDVLTRLWGFKNSFKADSRSGYTQAFTYATEKLQEKINERNNTPQDSVFARVLSRFTK